MNDSLIQSVAARWARLGAMINVAPAPTTPDIERLLLDTARAASANSRLVILAATWLARHGGLVSDQRLAQLITVELEKEHRPTLGFLLEWAAQHAHSAGNGYHQSIASCGSAIDERPLFDVERSNPKLVLLAKERASDLSRKWGRWAAEFELKDRAIRPERWILKQNPALQVKTTLVQ